METNKSVKSDKALKIFSVLVTAVVFVVFFCLFINGFDNYSDAGFLYSVTGKGGRIFLALLAFSFFVLLYRTSGILFNYCSHRVCKWLRLGMWLCFILLQGWFLFYIRSYYKWDSGFIIGGAASLAETGTVADEAFYYLSVYPNQNTFVLITAFLIKLCNLFGVSVANRPLVFNLFNTVCMDLSVFLLYSLIKKLYTYKAADRDIDRLMCRVQLILLCNPFLYLGVSYYYTVTLSWIFTVGFIYLLFDDFSIVRWIIAGVVLGIGYELRATAIIFAAAALCIGCFNRMRKEYVIKLALICLTAFLSAQLLAAGQRAYVGIDTTDTEFPVSHWIMMSLTQPGGHNAEDESFTASFATKEEKQAAVRNRIKEKLQTMGVGGYIQLVSVKVKRTFGDGMNGYTTFLADGYGTGKLYDLLFGAKKDFVILWHQGYYLFMVAGMLSAMIWELRKSFGFFESEEEYRIYKTTGFFLLVMLGAVLFYILWEASEQYSVPFMPVMLCLFSIGMLNLPDCEKEAVNQRKISYLYLVPAVLFAVWSVIFYTRFTNHPFEQSRTAAVQILANEPAWLDDGEEMVQELSVKQPFNHLVMQWRNPSGENNDAVYEIVLCSADEQILCMREEIVAKEGGNNGAGIYTFVRTEPSKTGITDYEIRIRKISGSPDCDLQFVLYDMYGYTPYPGGELVIYGPNREKHSLPASLLFLLSEETEGAYASPKKYIFFTSCVFLIFLFMGICCKIEKIGKAKRSYEVSV